MQQCKHSQCLSIALQAAPDSTRFTQCRISLFTISLIPHTHTCAEPDLTSYPTHSHLCGTRFDCAADFSLLNLPKGKSLGRSKPATNSYAQALQHTMRKTSTISKSYWTAFYRNKMSTINVSELGYLFHDKSSLHIIAWDLDVERSQLYNIVLDDVKAGMMSNPVTQWRICYYKYALTTVKGASVK